MSGDRCLRQSEGWTARPAGDQAGVEDPAQVADVGELGGPGVGQHVTVRGCVRGRPEHLLDHQSDDPDVAGGGDDDGVGVDPLVAETGGVDAGERVRDLPDHPGGLQTGQRAMGQDRLERLAVGVLADDVVARLGSVVSVAAVVGSRVDVHHVQDAQEACVRRDRGAPGEIEQIGRVAGARRQQVHQHRARQHLVERPPGDGRVRLGQQLLQPVARPEHGAGRESRGLRSRGRAGSGVVAAARLVPVGTGLRRSVLRRAVLQGTILLGGAERAGLGRHGLCCSARGGLAGGLVGECVACRSPECLPRRWQPADLGRW